MTLTSDAPVRVSSTPPSAIASSFRLDIEGLRAVTALLVAGFHIWGGKVSGGVDVFFVVSGYFITLTLLGHVRRYGSVRPGTFLARLGQRLGPTALTVLVATMLVTWLVLSPSVREAAFAQAIASLFSVENLALAFQSTDYLAQSQPMSPVQQFWAMSVQGQFYLIWLFVAVCAVWLSARSRVTAYGAFGIVVAVLSLVSFGWSIAQTTNDQAFAYFSPLTRVWEFGIGAAVALLLPRLALGRSLRIVMVWLGLVGIIAGAALLPVESEFPGYAALWPTLCAALILVSGQKGDSWRSNALLNHPVLVWMGGFAFAIYLWHWPLLIAARSIRASDEMGWLAGSAVIAVSIVLAWSTSRWLERPLMSAARSDSAAGRRRGNTILIVAYALTLTMAVSSLVADRVQNDVRWDLADLSAGELDCFGARSVLMGDPTCGGAMLEEPLLPAGAVAADLQRVERECAVRKYHAEARMCAYGDIGSEHRIGLIGNSHAIAWFPALERIAIERGWELRVWYKSGCQFTSPQRADTKPRLAEECARWVENVQADITSGPKITWIATSTHGASTWADADGEETGLAARDAMRSAWGPLNEAGVEIVAIRDYPKSSDGSLACVERAGPKAVDDCAVLRSDVLTDHDEMYEQALAMEGAHAIDLTDAICDANTCWTAAGHVKVYRDRSHLSNTFAASIWPLMEQRLEEAGLIDAVLATG